MAEVVAALLLYRRRTRAGWIAVGVLTGGFVMVTLPLAFAGSDNEIASVVTFGLAMLYAWVADGAWRLALAWRSYVAVDGEHLVVRHPGILPEPVILHRDEVAETEVDPRPWHERRTAAGLRAKAFGGPTFLDAKLPVISAAPSAHGEATAAAPNLVIRFGSPRQLPAAPASIRMLLRLSQGKSGSYLGPKPRRTYPGLRLIVEDVAPLVPVLDAWERLDVETRDADYLSPVTARDHRRYRRRRLLVALGVTAITALFAVLELLAR